MAAFFLLLSGVVSRGEDNESKQLSKMSSSANRPKATAFHEKKAPASSTARVNVRPTARVNVNPTARMNVNPTARVNVSPVAAPMSTARSVGRGGVRP